MNNKFASRFTLAVMPLIFPVLSLGPIGCSGSADPNQGASQSTETTSTAASSLTGETIFEGIFFGRGAVAKLFPELWGDTTVLAPKNGTVTREEILSALDSEKERASAAGRTSAVATLTDVSERLKAGPATLDAALTNISNDKVAEDARLLHIVNAMKAADPDFFSRFGEDARSGNRVRIARAMEGASAALYKAATGETEMESAAGVHPDCAVVFVVVAIAVAVYLAFVVKPKMTAGSPGLSADELVDAMATRLAAQ